MLHHPTPGATECGDVDGETAVLSSVSALFCIPIGFAFPCLAAVMTIASETHRKHVRAVVNLSTPLSAVYCAWFTCLSMYVLAASASFAIVRFMNCVHVLFFLQAVLRACPFSEFCLLFVNHALSMVIVCLLLITH